MSKNTNYTTRESYYYAMYHQFDDLKNTGYNWRDNTIKKSVSSYILSDPKRVTIIERYQILIAAIIDYVSNIKKAAYYSADKNYKYLN